MGTAAAAQQVCINHTILSFNGTETRYSLFIASQRGDERSETRQKAFRMRFRRLTRTSFLSAPVPWLRLGLQLVLLG